MVVVAAAAAAAAEGRRFLQEGKEVLAPSVSGVMHSR